MSSLPVVGQCLSDNFDFFCCWKNIGVCVGTYFCFCNTAGHVAAQKVGYAHRSEEALCRSNCFTYFFVF